MERRERKDSHRLIEECMLAANEAVARFFREEGLPSVYRFHAEPDEEKLTTFVQLAQAYGFRLQPQDVSSKELNAFMAQLQGHPEERALNQILLRSMMQAVYTASSVGHYGLAAEYYLHFTSPIRRYPDLLVHRLLKAHWARRGATRSPSLLEREEQRLEEMATQSSERERAAMQVEREVVSYYAALMMKDRIGEEFSATVSGLADIGLFVELDDVHVEGLVRADSLGPGGRFDKALHTLVYPGGRRVRVGQKLRVRLTSVNLGLRRIDFAALEFLEQGRAAPPAKAEESVAPERVAPSPAAQPGFERLRTLAARRKKGTEAKEEEQRPAKKRPAAKRPAAAKRSAAKRAAPKVRATPKVRASKKARAAPTQAKARGKKTSPRRGGKKR
jgi:ribonuclease R